MDPVAAMKYDKNSGFCPAPHDQFKKLVAGQFYLTGSEHAVFMEPEWYKSDEASFCPAPRVQFKKAVKGRFDGTGSEEAPKSESHKCHEASVVENITLRAGGAFTLVANLGPLMLIWTIAHVPPRRKKMLFLSSVFLAISNILWTVYLGREHCIDLSSHPYASLVIGSLLHGSFSWFFWQDNAAPRHSFIAVIGSSGFIVAVALLAKSQYMDTVMAPIWARRAVGFLGLLLTGCGIYNRRRANDTRPDSSRVINIICSSCGTACFMYCMQWWDWEHNALSDEVTFYKIGVTVLFFSRLYEGYELLVSCVRVDPKD